MTEDGELLWLSGLEVLRLLQGQGHEAYLVGGCVRDRLLGRPLRDIDIATSARPEEVGSVFARTIPTGLRHGTVTVLHDGRSFEVTTYRTESGYSDARRPDRVDFVGDIREDLARRDFTVNAMAVGLHGEWVDPFGGREDLRERKIRCVGDASRRFGEDALRMMRAIRFAAEFGFQLNVSVWRAIHGQAPRLRQVSMERIGSEWDKMMAGPNPDRACGLLLRSGLLVNLKEPLPASVAADKPPGDGGNGIRKLCGITEPDVRWIAWLAQCGTGAAEASIVCRALRFSGKREARISAGVAFHSRMTAAGSNHDAFLSALLDLGRSAAEDWLETRTEPGPFDVRLKEIVWDSVGQLAVKGDELARHLNREPGPWVAKLLRRLLEETASGRLPNVRETLLQAALKIDNS